MPTKKMHVVTASNVDLFDSILRGFSSLVSTFESKISFKGYNISNWKAQLVGNAGLNFACRVRCVIDGKKYGKQLAAEFMLAGTKGESGSRLMHYATGKIDDKITEVLSAIGFLFEQLIIGKPLSVVNVGRGLILQSILINLKPTELYIDIIDVPVDDNNKVTYTFDLDDVNNFTLAYARRGRFLLDLDATSGQVTKVLTERKPIKDIEW